MTQLKGSCHCGNVRLEIALSRAPASYQPRACDCDFCRKHGAAYISDPAGALRIETRDDGKLVRYRQGSGTAECLLCSSCGVLVGAVYRDDTRTFATVNTRVVEGATFGNELTVSPKKLGVDEKISRWKELWFPKVSFVSQEESVDDRRRSS